MAIEALEQGEYDLVLMDCQMPVMDGYAATRTLRARDDALAKIGIIALTANAMEGDSQKCIEAGMDDYLSKPFDPKVLEAKIHQLLLQKQLEQSTLTTAQPAISEADSNGSSNNCLLYTSPSPRD